MKDSWIQSILTQDQFRKIDLWIYRLMKDFGTADPLKNSDYCVLIRKHAGLDREVFFSPNCFHLLCEAQPEFLSLDTKVIPKPELLNTPDSKESFVYWFGNIRYFFKLFPSESAATE